LETRQNGLVHHFPLPLRLPQTLSQLTPQAQEQHRNELLSLQICTIAPQTSYELTTDNLYDYDLPPGLVTLRVARTVLQLYRRGGRLTPKSVHKLLRLGMVLTVYVLVPVWL
jgi:hypothetical protein